MKKAALLLDEDLVAEAKRLLDAKSTTETLNEVLLDFTNRAKRQQLVERLATLDPEDLAWIEKSWDRPGDGNASH